MYDKKKDLIELTEDVDRSIELLKKIDQRCLGCFEKMGLIETVAIKTSGEISRNTIMIAENMKEMMIANKQLVELVAGKNQVPVPIFMMVIIIIAMIEFVLLVAFFGVQLKFGNSIFSGEIIPKLAWF